MERTRTVISKSVKRTSIPRGSNNYFLTEQVVYKYPIGKVKGKMKFRSETKHEKIN